MKGDPATWTSEEARAAQAELDELERTDPDVAVAAASYDRMVERMTGRRYLDASYTSGEEMTDHVMDPEYREGM